MITIKTTFALSLVALLLVSFAPVLVNAQESTDVQLPDPGILPDSPFYGLKKAFESIGTSFTFGDDSKAQRALELAQTRLAEARAMIQAGKPEFVENLMQEYGQGIDNANNIAASLEDAEKKETVTEKVATATSRHLLVFDDIQERVPDQARDSVIAAREHSMRGNQQALEALATEDPVRAAEITMDAAEKRANKVRQAVESGDSDEAIQAAQDYEEYERLGEEIATMAKRDGKNATRVLEIVTAARSNHLEVLQGVLEHVPEVAKPTIQQVIADSEERLEAFPSDRVTRGEEERVEQKRNTDSESDSEKESSEEENGRNDEARSSS